MSYMAQIISQNERKSRRRAATTRYGADVRAREGVTAAKMRALTISGGGDQGTMTRAKLAAGVERESIAQRSQAALMVSQDRLGKLRSEEDATALARETFEFEKSYLAKKKKKKDPIEAIESIAATPRY